MEKSKNWQSFSLWRSSVILKIHQHLPVEAFERSQLLWRIGITALVSYYVPPSSLRVRSTLLFGFTRMQSAPHPWRETRQNPTVNYTVGTFTGNTMITCTTKSHGDLAALSTMLTSSAGFRLEKLMIPLGLSILANKRDPSLTISIHRGHRARERGESTIFQYLKHILNLRDSGLVHLSSNEPR